MKIWIVAVATLSAALVIGGLDGPSTASADGACAWSRVDAPSPSTTQSELRSVDGAGPNDIWAVGSSETGPQNRAPLTEHWDGSGWTVVTAPTAGNIDWLYSVSVISPNDVWAVGTQQATGPGPLSTLAEHWNGRHGP